MFTFQSVQPFHHGLVAVPLWGLLWQTCMIQHWMGFCFLWPGVSYSYSMCILFYSVQFNLIYIPPNHNECYLMAGLDHTLCNIIYWDPTIPTMASTWWRWQGTIWWCMAICCVRLSLPLLEMPLQSIFSICFTDSSFIPSAWYVSLFAEQWKLLVMK